MPWESGRFESLAQFQRWARGRAESDNQTRALIAWMLDYAHGMIRGAVSEAIASAFGSHAEHPEETVEQYRARIDKIAASMPGYWEFASDRRRDD